MPLPTRITRAMLDPLVAVHREFDDAVNRFFGQQQDGGQFALYPVDIREDADHIYVDAELPGFKKEDVELTLENQTLTISAERHEEKREEPKADYLLRERRFTRFLRSFTLPPTVDEKKVDAKLNDGVLTIVLNKREETKPRKIPVS